MCGGTRSRCRTAPISLGLGVEHGQQDSLSLTEHVRERRARRSRAPPPTRLRCEHSSQGATVGSAQLQQATGMTQVPVSVFRLPYAFGQQLRTKPRPASANMYIIPES